MYSYLKTISLNRSTQLAFCNFVGAALVSLFPAYEALIQQGLLLVNAVVAVTPDYAGILTNAQK